jgi:chorismate synthase
MSHNTFGHLFRVTTFGESHGPALGCVVDGCPPRIPLTWPRSRPSSIAAAPASRASRRSAASRTRCASCPGVFQDETGGQVTTGTPIALMIENVDQRSKDYSEIATSTVPATPITPTT